VATEPAAWSISRLASALSQLLSSDPDLGDLWLEGEVSNLRRTAAGHVYFTLKDEGAQVRCVLFRGRYGAAVLENGLQALAHGHVDFYGARGDLQFYVDYVRAAGVGLRQAQLERLRAELEAEGLFDPARKRPLPAFPRRVGVATSPVGAVFHDICNIIARRWPLAEVVLAPTAVQGPEAVPGVIEALRLLNEEAVDVIIVARGGGSLEELWAFNEEPVVRAIYASRVPVICGIGHEPDLTLADLAADLRAPTPSAAAELAVPDMAALLHRLRSIIASLEEEAEEAVRGRSALLAGAMGRLERALPDLEELGRRTLELARRLHQAGGRGLDGLAERLAALQRHLVALEPRATLARGYAIVRRQGGPVVTGIEQVAPGDRLEVQVARGRFPAEVSRQYGF
jgi:exodeoxyribonuclease VII large subunit